MFDELESVILTHDIDEYGLKEGDVGVVVSVYDDGVAYEVEFMRPTGETIGVLTLNSNDLNPKIYKEVLNTNWLSSKLDYYAFGTAYNPSSVVPPSNSNATIVNPTTNKKESKTIMFYKSIWA